MVTKRIIFLEIQNAKFVPKDIFSNIATETFTDDEIIRKQSLNTNFGFWISKYMMRFVTTYFRSKKNYALESMLN